MQDRKEQLILSICRDVAMEEEGDVEIEFWDRGDEEERVNIPKLSFLNPLR